MTEQNNNCAMHHKICEELTNLYRIKNHDYGDSFHKSYIKWGLPMAAIRLEDKLNRFETLIKADGKVKDESIRDTLIDLANYAILTVMELDRSTATRDFSGKYYQFKCANCGTNGVIPVECADVSLRDMTMKCPDCNATIDIQNEILTDSRQL